MNKQKRIELVRAMNTVARSCNDEELIMYWLSVGVADGDASGSDDSLECYIEDDDDFAELMAAFLKVVSSAKKEAGLYCDGVCSEN